MATSSQRLLLQFCLFVLDLVISRPSCDAIKREMARVNTRLGQKKEISSSIKITLMPLRMCEYTLSISEGAPERYCKIYSKESHGLPIN
jgi:hypothetical protein